jgi:hypothetical protein
MRASPSHLSFTVMAIILSGCMTLGCSSDSFLRGAAGESCRARNDCASGLSCINERCAPGTPPLSVTGRACYRVQCGADADCCADFVPASGCDVYERACQANPKDCDAFRTLCQCRRTCANELCVDPGPSCTTNAHCPSSTAPYCVDRRCVECREHGDCLDTERCVSGTCQAACKTSENCPPLHACTDGLCVPSGCTTDRECVFVLGNPKGRCANGACIAGCADSAECNAQALEVCQGGQCTFAGCQTDAECRAYLDLNNSPDNTRAVCR